VIGKGRQSKQLKRRASSLPDGAEDDLRKRNKGSAKTQRNFACPKKEIMNSEGGVSQKAEKIVSHQDMEGGNRI
jgi:hypothetical protein